MLSKKRPRIRIVRRSDKYSQNAEAIANNYDLLILILVRLPVKSLLRFKSVSKTWHSIISDPEFSCRLFPDISGLVMRKLGSPANKPEYGFIPLGNKSSADDAPFKYLDFINHPSDDPDSNFVSQQIEIYSSQTRSWRLSGKPFLAHVNTEFGGGVFCNGAIHWLGAWNNTSFYFNVQDEELRDLPMPPIPDDWEDLRQCRYFGESQNHLHTSNNSILCVRDFAYPGMVRTYSVPSDLNYYVFSVLCIVREADDEESHMVLHIPEKAIHYNLKDRSFKKICDLDADENGYKGSPV
ncbi:hypothetical protein ES332_D07G053300v1 [Gossypium tomentosum]|uniref:F-box domain-containing protein n=1 Tax=Gossypium tomentosum TaxID=34277 RepID=A0A5D2K3M1_GOSTO|nr:hypothetical protein ES332_D07G053300v1 [Gossypium tomentosum]